jgi:hypothetical protein
MNIAAYMLTCPERAEVRERTLASWKASDWRGSPARGGLPRLVLDTARTGRREERQARAARALLERAVEEGAEWVLFLEDDLEFNRYLRHNLEHWPPLARIEPGGHFYGSLYNPNVGELERRPRENSFIAWPKSVYGSQAVLLSRATVLHLLSHWDEVAGMQDIKMSRLAAQVCPLVFHSPSLVQHTGVNSVWGGTYHTARDYQATWKSLPDRDQRLVGVAPSGVGPIPADFPLEAILARVRPIEGWLEDEEASLLIQAVLHAVQLQSAGLVEVGSYCGKASLAIALTLKTRKSPQKLHAVDTFEGILSVPGGRVMRNGPTLEKFARTLAAGGVRRQVKVHPCRSSQVNWDQPLSLLLIDGLHDGLNLRADFQAFGSWIVPGGLALFHDCTPTFPSVVVFVKELCSQGYFRLVSQAGSMALLQRVDQAGGLAEMQ